MNFLFNALASINGTIPHKNEKAVFEMNSETLSACLTHKKGTLTYVFHNKIFFDIAQKFIQHYNNVYTHFAWNPSLKEHPVITGLILDNPESIGKALHSMENTPRGHWKTFFQELYEQYTLFHYPDTVVLALQHQYLRRLDKISMDLAFTRTLNNTFSEESRSNIIDFCLQHSPELMKNPNNYRDFPEYRVFLKSLHGIFHHHSQLLEHPNMWRELRSFECDKTVNYKMLQNLWSAEDFKDFFIQSFRLCHIKNKNAPHFWNYFSQLSDNELQQWWKQQTPKQHLKWLHYVVHSSHATSEMIDAFRRLDPVGMEHSLRLSTEYSTTRAISPEFASKLFKNTRYQVENSIKNGNSECQLML